MAVLPASAQAFDFSLEPDRTRYLADPSYMQAKGELDGGTIVGYSDTKEERYLADGALSPKLTENTWTTTQNFEYGITNRIRIAISQSYTRQDQKDAYPDNTQSFHASGFENPVFSARGRFIPQNKAPFYLDFGASYSPDLFTAKVASTHDNGTTASGDQEFTSAIHLGREMKSLTTQLTFAAIYFGDGSRELPNSANTRSHEGYWNYGLKWDNQLRFTDSIFLNLGMGISQDETHERNQSGSNPASASYGLGTNFYLSPGYVLIPKKLTLNADASLTYPGDQTDTFPNSTEQWKNQQELYFGLHLRYKIL